MIDLHLDRYKQHIKLKREKDQRYIFDPVRSKWLALRPEELVRQLVIQFLLIGKGYNKNRIAIEKSLTVNELNKRCDLLVYDPDLQPFMLIECKAPHVNITNNTFRQIAWYNMPLQVRYLLVTNGYDCFCCVMDYKEEVFEFLDRVPDYPAR